MTQKSLSKWLKGIIIGIALCGLVIYGFLLPMFGRDLAVANPEFAYCYEPWLAILWISAVPCYLVLYNGWKITTQIARDNSFSLENARYLKHICILALVDSVYFFLANIVLLFLNMNHPAILLASLFVDFAGVVVAVTAASLSHLVLKAAEIQQENQLTI
ncbi:MAG: DUF2975 domain-containing protein [Lachnospiraceae bacterium]|jgi:Protein of unknown function (DUF3036).|nr:DUF2975 domain-containing protein [Lachnospiraceae bacterium]